MSAVGTPWTTTELVCDINQTTAPVQWESAPPVELNGLLYGFMNHPHYGMSLWKTDGTAQGTSMVADVNPAVDYGSVGGATYTLTRCGNLLYFTTDHQDYGWGLWKTDGTIAGTALVKAVEPSGHSIPDNLVASDDTLYFTTGFISGTVLWRTDGTEEGTVVVPTTDYSGWIEPRLIYDNRLIYRQGSTYYITDGAPSGTLLLSQWQPKLAEVAITHVAELNGLLLVIGEKNGKSGIWKIKDDSTATRLDVSLPKVAEYNTILKHGNLLYLEIPGLWVTDGSKAGTYPLLPSTDGSKPLHPWHVTPLKSNTVYFLTDRNNTAELWKSDGTRAGTTLVITRAYSAGLFPFSSLLSIGETLYFYMTSDTEPYQLWKSDGTSQGTGLDPNFSSETWPPYFSHPVEYNGSYFFRAVNNSTFTTELWKSDVTGLQLAPAFQLTTADSAVHPFSENPVVRCGDKWYFAADDGIHGRELWTTDGTAAGTMMLGDLFAGPEGSGPSELTAVGHKLFFTARQDLWVTDGTLEGTFQLGAYAYRLAAGPGGLLYFCGVGPEGGELWVSDGTPGGTTLVKDIHPGEDSSDPVGMVAYGDQIYFTAYTTDYGRELWKSDGTEEGTMLVADLYPGYQWEHQYSPFRLGVYNGKLYFGRWNENTHPEIWTSDGTVDGTRIVLSHHEPGIRGIQIWAGFNHGFIYSIIRNSNERELYWSDGTAPGVFLKRLLPRERDSIEFDLQQAGDFLFFKTWNPDTNQMEEWRTDGTVAGTVPLTQATEPLDLADAIFFAGIDAQHGIEPWISDGMASGRQLIKDLFPGGSSVPESFSRHGNQVLFWAHDGVHGKELWSITINNPAAATRWELYE